MTKDSRDLGSNDLGLVNHNLLLVLAYGDSLKRRIYENGRFSQQIVQSWLKHAICNTWSWTRRPHRISWHTEIAVKISYGWWCIYMHMCHLPFPAPVTSALLPLNWISISFEFPQLLFELSSRTRSKLLHHSFQNWINSFKWSSLHLFFITFANYIYC